jgi:hypothetical protein
MPGAMQQPTYLAHPSTMVQHVPQTNLSSRLNSQSLSPRPSSSDDPLMVDIDDEADGDDNGDRDEVEDMVDADAEVEHPTNCRRPITSGPEEPVSILGL